MKALVVYESMFGNTEMIARSIGRSLTRDFEVVVTPVSSAPLQLAPYTSLLVVGGPTHGFSMSRPRTRQDAVKQGSAADARIGIREWLARVQVPTKGITVATFDTRARGVRHLPGSAAKGAARLARTRGMARVVARESFYVTGTAGPLVEGETERAAAWARTVGRHLSPQARERS